MSIREKDNEVAVAWRRWRARPETTSRVDPGPGGENFRPSSGAQPSWLGLLSEQQRGEAGLVIDANNGLDSHIIVNPLFASVTEQVRFCHACCGQLDSQRSSSTHMIAHCKQRVGRWMDHVPVGQCQGRP